MEVTAKALRGRVGTVLACLDRGESVTITYRGKPRARLVAIAAEGEKESETPAFGMWRDRDDLEDVRAYVRGLRMARTDVG